jgi:hypothetical protein
MNITGERNVVAIGLAFSARAVGFRPVLSYEVKEEGSYGNIFVATYPLFFLQSGR